MTDRINLEKIIFSEPAQGEIAAMKEDLMLYPGMIGKNKQPEFWAEECFGGVLVVHGEIGDDEERATMELRIRPDGWKRKD